MRPIYHVLSSAGVAAFVFGLSGSPLAAGASFVAGVVIDVDHLVDYVLARGLRFDLQEFLTDDYFRDAGKIVIPLHSVELLAPLWLLSPLSGWTGALAATIGFCLHLLLDQLAYPFRPLVYSFLFRWRHGFDRSVLVLERGR